jgi:hypothetical protein
MQIFISWSGKLSKDIGETFKKWIPSVLQVVKPYFTPDDIEKGTRWSTEIAKELEQSQVGIVIVTRQNLQSPWIMFESGALSKQLTKSRICPILFGVENTDLQGPLVQFQTTSFIKDDMFRLIKNVNGACSEQRLEESVLSDVFEKWWPDLEKTISSKLQKHKETSGQVRSDRELIEEILSLTRITSSRSREESLEHHISTSAWQDLLDCYLRIDRCIEEEDFSKLRLALNQMRRPIDYIAHRSGYPTPGMLRSRESRDRSALKREVLESEEKNDKEEQ